MRRKQIYFRTIAGILIVSVIAFMFFLDVVRRRADQRQEIVSSLTDAGAFVLYEHMKVPGSTRYDPTQDLAVPNWLRAIFSDHAFLVVDKVSVGTDGKQFGDRELRQLSRLPTVRHVGLDGTQISDAGTEFLALLSNVDSLSLDLTDISDEAIPHLSKLQGLRNLSLHDTRITPIGVQYLQKALPKTTIDYANNHAYSHWDRARALENSIGIDKR